MPEKINIILDMSKIDLFLLCEERFNLRHNIKKELPISMKSSSLDKGSLAHTGLEVYYKLLAEGKHYNDRMQACLLKIKATAADPELSNVDIDELNPLLAAVEQSCDYWRSEDETFRIKSVESPFLYTLYEDDELRILISGKIDLLVDKPAIGAGSEYIDLPIDHKTAERNFDTPRLSNQFINYCAATGSNYLIKNQVGLQKSLKPEEKFKRDIFSYDPFIIQDWKDNLIKIIKGRYLDCIARDEWTMNFTSCLKFNRLCEYYEICNSSGKEAKLFKLATGYVDAKEWDVTKELSKDQ